MKTFFTQLLRIVLRVRRPKMASRPARPARRMADSAGINTATTLVAIEPLRTIAIGRDAAHVKLVYRLGEQNFILSFPDTTNGFIQAAIAIGNWLDDGIGFDQRAYREIVQAINGMLDEECEGSGNQGVIHL